MADRKITDLTALAAGSQATGDLLTIVDVSEAAATDKNKKITVESLFKGIPSNVGIGTSSPDHALDLIGTTSNALRIRSSTAASRGLEIWNDSGNDIAYISNYYNGSIVFQTGNTERMRIDSSGRLGVGTTSPQGNLHVVGASGGAGEIYVSDVDVSSAGSSSLLLSQSGNNSFIYNRNTSGQLRLGAGGASDNVVIDSSGRVGIGTTSPGHKLVVSQNNSGGIAAIHLPEDESTILGSNANTNIKMGGNMTVSGGGAMLFNTAGSESARIDSSGNLLIGTTSSLTQSAELRVSGSGVATAEFYNSGGCYNTWSSGSTATARGYVGSSNQIVSSGSDSDFAVRAQSNLIFATGGNTERMRITSAGDVLFNNTTTATPGLGNTTLGASFENLGSNGGAFFCSRSGGTAYFANRNEDGTISEFRRSGTTVGTVSVTSSSTAYNTSSDYRLKENVVDLDGAITRVKQLAPKRFNFIVDADTTVDGFLAHEAQTVVPEAVTGTHNEVDDDGNAVMQGIDQSKLVPLLTAALQEAIAEIETLKTKVAVLEAG